MSFVDKVEGIRRGLATTYCPWCPLTRSQPTTFRVKDYRYPLDLVNATRTHTGESLCDVRAFSQITPSILSASNVIIRSQMHTLTSRHVTSQVRFLSCSAFVACFFLWTGSSDAPLSSSNACGSSVYGVVCGLP